MLDVCNSVLGVGKRLIVISNKYNLTTILNKVPYLVLLESKHTDFTCLLSRGKSFKIKFGPNADTDKSAHRRSLDRDFDVHMEKFKTLSRPSSAT